MLTDKTFDFNNALDVEISIKMNKMQIFLLLVNLVWMESYCKVFPN